MYYFSIGGIFEQENSWLDEWIRYYKAVGAEHFYLYNNDADTRVSDKILHPYVATGIVENIHVRDHENLCTVPKSLLQLMVMKDLILKTSQETYWLALIDLDEFILPRSHDKIPTFLQNYEKFGALAISWLRYGSSGWIRRPASQINHFLYHAHTISPSSFFFKCIVKPDCVDTETMMTPQRRVKVPHIFPLRNSETVNEKYDIINPSSFRNPFTGDEIVINHYAIRSYQDFWEVKYPRGRFNGMEPFHSDHFDHLDENDVFNNEISCRFGFLVD